MSDKLLGSDINPKATVQAKTDISENYVFADGFNPYDYIEKPKPQNLEVSIGDGAKAAVSSGLRSVQGVFEIPNQINHSSTEQAYMQRVPEDLRTNAKPTPFAPIRDTLSSVAVDKLGGWADSVQSSMSPDAQKAMNTPFYQNGEVSTDPAVWGIQFANIVGYMAPTVATMIATRKVPIDKLAPNIKNLMLRSGVSLDMAEKALPYTLNAMKNTPALGVGVASDIGSQGVQAREMTLNASHEQLMQSPTYIQAFRDVHSDPANANLSNEQKFKLAKERVSNIVSQDTMTDPKTIAASVLATGLGDVALSRALLSGTAKGVGGLRGAAAGFVKGGAKEGVLEFGQEYTTQRVSNEISNRHVGTNLDLDDGAMDAGINGLIGGFAMGGSMGAAGGLRKATQPTSEVAPEAEAVVEGAEVNSKGVDAPTSDVVPEVATESHPNDFINTPARNRQQENALNELQPAVVSENNLASDVVDASSTDAINPPADIEPIVASNENVQPSSDETVVTKPIETTQPEDQVIEPKANPELRKSIYAPEDIQSDLETPAYLRKPVPYTAIINGESHQINANTDDSIGLDSQPERNGAGTQLVPSEARPSVIYGHDNTPQQQVVSLDDKQVGMPQFENGIPKNKLRQLKYLAQRTSDKIPLAMQSLKGAARFTRPEYRTRLVSLADEATAMSNSKTINVQVDTISDAITKLGGVSRASAESDGIDPAAFKRNRLFPAKDGRTFDELAELLNEHGFTSRTGGKLGANDVLDLVDGEVNNGERHFSTQSDMLTETDQGSALSDLVREYGTERVQTAISKALTGARLGDRQAEIVSEAMDVIETGRIEQAGGIEARRAERDVRSEARIAKRRQKVDTVNGELGLPAWVNDDAVQAESEYTETVEAALDQAINHAAIADSVAAEALLDQYEANKITMASLVDQLGALKYDNQQRLGGMENTQSTTERAHSDSSTQRIEQGQENTQSDMGTIRSSSTTSDQQHAAIAEVEPTTDIEPQVEVAHQVDTATAPQVEITQDSAIETIIEPEQSDISTQQEVITDTQAESGLETKEVNDNQGIKNSDISEVSVKSNNDIKLTAKLNSDNTDYSFDVVKDELDAGRGHLIPSEYLQRYSKEYQSRNNTKSVLTEKNVHFSKESISKEEVSKYVNKLHQAMKSLKSRVDPVVISRTPNVLKALGVDDRNIYIDRDIVRKVTNGVKDDHDIGMDIIENLPNLLADPVAVFRPKDEKVAATGAKNILVESVTPSGKKILVALHLNKEINRKPAITVASAYGKTAKNYQTWINEGLLEYVKSKNPDWLLLQGLQLPKGSVDISDERTTNQGSNKTVRDDNDVVNNSGKSIPNKGISSKQGIIPENEHSGKGMPLKQAEMAVKSWLRQYNGGAMVNARVVKTQAEAEQILGASLDGYKVNAFYNEVDATVVVVADNIANTKELRQKLRHEILVHHGLRAVVGDAEYNRILKMVYSGLDSRFLKPLIAEVEQSYSRSNLNNFVEEVLAHTAENERNQIQQWRDRIIAKIAQILRKIGLLTPSDITKAELNNIVQTLTDRIKAVNEWDPSTPTPRNDNDVKGHLSRTKFSRTANDDSTSPFQTAVNQARAKLLSKVNGPIADVSDAGFDIPTENIKSVIARKWADQFQVLKELQKNIKKAGGKVGEDNDAYLAEEAFTSLAGDDLRRMEETFVEPLVDKMAKHKITQKMLDEYLIARHAKERNEYIASINPKFPDGGSGMKNADADAKLAEIKNSGKQKQYDELAHIIDAMIVRQREVLLDSGLESDAVVDTWKSHYKYYVPLKGTAKDESSLPRTGKGFSISGKESKEAKGRKSMAESPSGHAIIDLTEKLVRGRKNEVGNTLLKLVQDNPSNDYWEVFTNGKPDTAPQIIERKNPLTGEKEKVVEQRAVPMAMMADYYLPTKKNGQIYYIKLHDQRLMKAMKNLGVNETNGLLKASATLNRFIASVNTSYNPEFVVGNFLRDIQTAFLNLSAEQTRDDGKIRGENIAKQVIIDIKKAMPAVYASLRGKELKTKEGKEWQKYFDEFRQDGGKTGWLDIKDIDSQAKHIERMVAMANGTYTGKAYKVGTSIASFVDNANSAVENAVRLSAYVNARKAGISRKKSASLARNMTVNFNRRGEIGGTLGALYMFANASIQGSANFVRTMYGLNGDKTLKWENLHKSQKIAIGLVGGAFALAFANRSSSGDDKDGENWFDKVPDYVKERNFVIMKSLVGGEQDGTYWSIPMPYGYNIFPVLGSNIESALNSKTITPMRSAMNVALAIAGSFSPIGVSESNTAVGAIVKNATPTVGKPLVELALNENFFNGKIYKENMPFVTPLPDSSMSKRGTLGVYKDLAQWLNKVSDGSTYQSGMLDFSPDAMQYIVDYMGGAAARFATVKVSGLVDKVTGGDVDDSQVAFLSRISGRVMPYQDQSKFYDRRNELLQIKDESKVTFGKERTKFMAEDGYKLRLLPMLKATEKQLKALRKRRNAVYGLDMPTKQKDLRLKSIERQMKRLIDRFNLRYAQLEEK